MDNALAGADDGYYDHIEACGTAWSRMHRVGRPDASALMESLTEMALMERFAGSGSAHQMRHALGIWRNRARQLRGYLSHYRLIASDGTTFRPLDLFHGVDEHRQP